MPKTYTAAEVISHLNRRLLFAESQRALARALGLHHNLIALAVTQGYLSPRLAEALGYVPIKRMYTKKP